MTGVQKTCETELEDSQKLYVVAKRTNENGNVMLELTDWELEDDEIVAYFINPYGETIEKVFERPSSESADYKIVKVLESAGYGLASIDTACEQGAMIPADPEGDWEPAPEYGTPVQSSVKEWVEDTLTSCSNGIDREMITVILLMPLILLFALPKMVMNDNNNFGDGILVGFLGCALWLGAILVILL